MEWRLIFPWGAMSLAGSRQQPQARPFGKMTFKETVFEPIMGSWLVRMQLCVKQTQKTTRNDKPDGGKTIRRNGKCPRLDGNVAGLPKPMCYTATISCLVQAYNSRMTHLGHKKDHHSILFTLST
jgi:hypothetical protein